MQSGVVPCGWTGDATDASGTSQTLFNSYQYASAVSGGLPGGSYDIWLDGERRSSSLLSAFPPELWSSLTSSNGELPAAGSLLTSSAPDAAMLHRLSCINLNASSVDALRGMCGFDEAGANVRARLEGFAAPSPCAATISELGHGSASPYGTWQMLCIVLGPAAGTV